MCFMKVIYDWCDEESPGNLFTIQSRLENDLAITPPITLGNKI